MKINPTAKRTLLSLLLGLWILPGMVWGEPLRGAPSPIGSREANIRIQSGGSSSTNLMQLDARIQSGSAVFQAELRALNIKQRDVYQAYLDRASLITEKLIHVKALSEKRPTERFSLQRLAALSHALSLENSAFRNSFTHGEEQFYSYQLIQQAVLAMEDAVSYWRQSNEVRQLYRGTALDLAEDDEILHLKLQTAYSAIEQLRGIEKVRHALHKNLMDDLDR